MCTFTFHVPFYIPLIHQTVRCTFETVLPGKVLTVFVQPDDWTGDEEKRPMKKINVTVEHFLDATSVRGTAAMRSTENNCKRLLSDFHVI